MILRGRKATVYVLVFILVILIFLGLLVSQESFTAKYVRSRGFLIDSKKYAFSSYSEAIKYIRKFVANEPNIFESDNIDLARINSLVLQGARAQKLGVLQANIEPDIVTMNRERFDPTEFSNLARIASYIGARELKTNNFSKAQEIGFAVIAIGIQCHKEKDRMMQLLSIMYKSAGLELLKTCNEAQKDYDLQMAIDEMTIEFLKEKMCFERQRWQKR